ncbi:hypothetical protein BASA81_000016 [Batrachochytrium salamandrivorans]|nr:hypothetical protein BASA81_000016 [Batrachochytrium salamandrivorans]
MLEVTLKKFISKQDDPAAILSRAYAYIAGSPPTNLHYREQVEDDEEAEMNAQYQQQPSEYQLPARQSAAISTHRQHIHQEEDRIRHTILEEEIFRLTGLLERERSHSQEIKSELAKKTRELSNQTLQVETLTLHLNNFRESDSQQFLHSKKDRVMETESLKTKLSRAERDRDSLSFQIQEMERRHALHKDEESQIHSEFTTRVLENERRVSNAELARQRAEAEANACRQQLEHWKSAARFAQEEIASIRAHSSTSSSTGGDPMYKRNGYDYNNHDLPVESSDGSRAAANILLRRQQQQQQQQQGIDSGPRHQRLQDIAVQIKQLEDNMENIGSAATRTLQQRLTREKWRREIDELQREALTLQQH